MSRSLRCTQSSQGSQRQFLLLPILLPRGRLFLSRLIEEEGAVNNSLGDVLSSPEEVGRVAVAEAEALAIHHLLLLREVIFGVVAVATPESDLLSILLEEGYVTS